MDADALNQLLIALQTPFTHAGTQAIRVEIAPGGEENEDIEDSEYEYDDNVGIFYDDDTSDDDEPDIDRTVDIWAKANLFFMAAREPLDNDSLTCSICQDTLFLPVVLECGHACCYTCIQAMITTSTTMSINCPLCRRDISSTANLEPNRLFSNLLLASHTEKTNERANECEIERIKLVKYQAYRAAPRTKRIEKALTDTLRRIGIEHIDALIDAATVRVNPPAERCEYEHLLAVNYETFKIRGGTFVYLKEMQYGDVLQLVINSETRRTGIEFFQMIMHTCNRYVPGAVTESAPQWSRQTYGQRHHIEPIIDALYIEPPPTAAGPSRSKRRQR